MSAHSSLRSITGWFIVTFMLVVLPFSPVARADADGATAFVNTLSSRALEIMKTRATTPFEQREEQFKELLVEGFDIRTMGRFMIGRFWKDATDQQRKAYDEEFPNFITRVYAARFDAYNGETVEIVQTEIGSSGDDWVRTRINRPAGGQPISVDYRVRLSDGRYKVVDVIVEGVSMLNTHRAEFSAVVNKHGIDGLILEMQTRGADVRADACLDELQVVRTMNPQPKWGGFAVISPAAAAPLADELAVGTDGGYLVALRVLHTLSEHGDAAAQNSLRKICPLDQGMR